MNQHLHDIAIAWAIQVRTLEILAGRIFDYPIAEDDPSPTVDFATRDHQFDAE